MRNKITFIFIVFISISFTASAQLHILPLKERAIVQDALLKDRLENLLPALMRKEGIDMWLIVAREYNEDPVAKTMLPGTWLNARRRTILLFTDKGVKDGVEKLAVARYDIGTMFKGAWIPEKEPNQWKRLAELISERSPKKIGINISPQFAHADGLTKGEWDSLIYYIPAQYISNVVRAEKLAVNWLQLRTKNELMLYENICNIGHTIIAEGFSEKVIQPGVTTTDDVVWWLRERIAELKLQTWFHPTVDVQRSDLGAGDSQRSFATQPGKEIILPGDLLHVDFGITYLGLNTDVQQLAYVLKPGEKDAPAFLKKGLQTGNRLQDILTTSFAVNKKGNTALRESLANAKKENIVASIYTHPIGYHGHAAGPAIGMWDMQGGVPGSGDYTLQHHTAYAIELNAKIKSPEWNNKEIRIMLEEQAVFTPQGVRYINGRQKEFLLIPRSKVHLGE